MSRTKKRAKRSDTPGGGGAAAASVALGLNVVENPTGEFFKDEGGKTNHLTCTVALVGAEALPVDEKLSINVKLYFESGIEVSDAADCLKIQGNPYEKRFVSGAKPRCTVNFRLEKVSRRKDGQRFKLGFTLERDGTPIEGAAAAESSCVNVLSKRKPAARRKDANGGTPAKSGGTKRGRDMSGAAESRISLRLDGMSAQMGRIEMMQAQIMRTLRVMQGGGAPAVAAAPAGAKQAGGTKPFDSFASLALLDAANLAKGGARGMGPPGSLSSRVPNLRLISRDGRIVDPNTYGSTPRSAVEGAALAALPEHTLRLSGEGAGGGVSGTWLQSPRGAAGALPGGLKMNM